MTTGPKTIAIIGLGMVGIAEWYASQDSNRFMFHLSEKAISIDLPTNSFKTSGGRHIHYDFLVLATGSNATIPDCVSIEDIRNTKGLFLYRNIADLNDLMAYLEKGEGKSFKAVVVGGGLLGLEAAKAIHDQSSVSQVTIINRRAFPLSRQLDEDGGEMVLKRLQAAEVEFIGNKTVVRVDTDEEHVVTGVELVDGSYVSADLIIFAIGVTSRDDLAKEAGIECASNGGIIVNDELETNFKNVFAIGECANWKGNAYGLIAPGIEMADILSYNLTQMDSVGSFKKRQMNKPDLSTKLKLMGVDVASFGDYFADKVPQRPEFSRRDGMMVGDVSDYIKLTSLIQKRKPLQVSPGELISKATKQDNGGDDLEDDVRICSCHNVTKGKIKECILNGIDNINDLKSKTKAGTGCGGCIPLLTTILKAEIKKAGKVINNNICIHFQMSRADLYQAVRVKRLVNFQEIMGTYGTNKDSLGCEICKPVIGSILSSIHNEHILRPEHHQNQDTNDRFLANVQRDGTFSVVPRVAGGEITPDKLIVLGKVAKKYGLYTKITGGQRIDLFGAQKQDLPDIWTELIDAGFESGHAYGKALRTVKSCVGTTWCRYGVGDSVGLAILLEERYKGIRSPHKLKGGVSGCVRECAEAQSKDFGLIATDKGWNIFIAGNGGANPRHATLFATDVPPSKVVKIIDRYLMFYIRTADKLMRTARWVESFEGGVDKLKKIILDDELGICADLEKEMETLIASYSDEWSIVVNDVEKRKQFRQFVNTSDRVLGLERINERGQKRPMNWPKGNTESVKLNSSLVKTPVTEWKWREVATVADMVSVNAGTTSVAVKYGNSQLAIFRIPERGYYATQLIESNFGIGIIGDDLKGNTYVSCPLHKRNFHLQTGECLNDKNYAILTFEVKEDNGRILALLPDPDELDGVLGTQKWMVRATKSYETDRRSQAEIEDCGQSCVGGNKSLDW
ncbi:hypothetical protein Clacol_009307 [Clathrus columnatus]|uniref:Nitrite reductase [NAD(P)H] n=1 Tax=Clathrus columnatus TaxID=1419009 RepID=A0AAV5ANF5_9AGAM|nr:hypothetical protein Clacol_009307 [Clathrus columnatus]